MTPGGVYSLKILTKFHLSLPKYPWQLRVEWKYFLHTTLVCGNTFNIMTPALWSKEHCTYIDCIEVAPSVTGRYQITSYVGIVLVASKQGKRLIHFFSISLWMPNVFDSPWFLMIRKNLIFPKLASHFKWKYGLWWSKQIWWSPSHRWSQRNFNWKYGRYSTVTSPSSMV